MAGDEILAAIFGAGGGGGGLDGRSGDDSKLLLVDLADKLEAGVLRLLPVGGDKESTCPPLLLNCNEGGDGPTARPSSTSSGTLNGGGYLEICSTSAFIKRHSCRRLLGMRSLLPRTASSRIEQAWIILASSSFLFSAGDCIWPVSLITVILVEIPFAIISFNTRDSGSSSTARRYSFAV